jgi:hypothetical protein
MLNLFQHPSDSGGDPETPDGSGQGNETIYYISGIKSDIYFQTKSKLLDNGHLT